MVSNTQIIHHIDCLTGLRNLEPKSIDCIVDSPFYNIGVDYDGYDDCMTEADYIEFMVDVNEESFRVLKDTGHYFLQMGGISVDHEIPFQVLKCAQAAGFKLQNHIIWVKSLAIESRTYGHFKPINSPRFLNHCFEHIFHLTKDCNQSIDKLSVGVPFQDKSNLEKFGHTQDLRCAGDVWFIPYETVANAKLHPAAYPVELPKRCIQLAGLGKDAVVLDRFCGSGTTLVACKILNVSGLGFEKSARYVEITKQRLAKTRIQLFGV